MLSMSFAVLSAASGIGAVLAALISRADKRRPPWFIGAIHGGLGALGLAVLFVALTQSAPRGLAQGAAFFGWDAAVLLAAALLAGILLLVVRGRSALLLSLHAVLAIFGYVILATYVSFD
jgi:hypothetical protein